MPRRIWVVSELYYPESTSTGYFLTKIAEGLAQHYPVNVLCGQPTYAARGVRAPAREQRNGVNVQRCPATTFNKDVLLFRLANLATISVSAFLKALRQIGSEDYVLVVTNPPLLPFLIMAACRLRRAKLLLLIHDVYPEVLIAAGMVKPNSLVARFLRWATRRLYRTAERIIVLGRDMERLISSKLGAHSGTIVIIPNWADLDEVSITPRAQSRLLEELKLNNKFVVQYSGNMGRTHGLECVLEAAKRIASVSDIHFLLIGSGAKKQWLEGSVQKSHLLNVTVLPSRPQSELSDSLNACDVAVISFVPGMAGISVPSRMYNVLAAGKPIIAVADDNSELALVVREERVGWVVPPDQPDRLVEAILEARSRPDLLIQMRQRSRAAAERRFSLENTISSYVRVIADLS